MLDTDPREEFPPESAESDIPEGTTKEGRGETWEVTQARLADIGDERDSDRSGTHPGSQPTLKRDELGLRHVDAARTIVGETEPQDGE